MSIMTMRHGRMEHSVHLYVKICTQRLNNYITIRCYNDSVEGYSTVNLFLLIVLS